MEPGILALAEAALAPMQEAGWVVEPVAPPVPRELLWDAWTDLRAFSVAQDLVEHWRDPEARAQLNPQAVHEIERGLALTGEALARALDLRGVWLAALDALFATHDALVLPATQLWPFPVEWDWPREIAGVAMDTYHRWMEVVVPASLAGLPVLGMPAGLGEQGLPGGLQLIGPHGSERETDGAGPELRGGHRAAAHPRLTRFRFTSATRLRYLRGGRTRDHGRHAMSDTLEQHLAPSKVPAVNTMVMGDIGYALREGLRDFRRRPMMGLFFGNVAVMGGWLIYLMLFLWHMEWLAIPLTFGFPLIGPFLAVGLYEVSRRLEAGQIDWRRKRHLRRDLAPARTAAAADVLGHHRLLSLLVVLRAYAVRALSRAVRPDECHLFLCLPAGAGGAEDASGRQRLRRGFSPSCCSR